MTKQALYMKSIGPKMWFSRLVLSTFFVILDSQYNPRLQQQQSMMMQQQQAPQGPYNGIGFWVRFIFT